MKIITVLLVILITVSNCFAYEKWEPIGSNSESTCYIDLENITPKNDSEYVIKLMFKYKKLINVPIVTKTNIKGKIVSSKTTGKASARVDTAILDISKSKIYIQSSYFKTEIENIHRQVSPDDIIPSDSIIYTSALSIIASKYKLDSVSTANKDNSKNTDKHIDAGIKAFFDISKSDGLDGAKELTNYCYEQVTENKNTNYFIKCVAIDTAGMYWVKFLVEHKKFSGNEYFSQSNVKSRIINALKLFDIKQSDYEQIADGMMEEIHDRYKQYLLSNQ